MMFRYLLLLLSLGCGSQNGETATNNHATPEETNDVNTIIINELEEEEECLYINGYKPCNFTTFDVNGNEVNLHDFEGKPFIVDISAMWCGPCQRAGSEVQSVQDAHAEHNLQYITLLIENTSGETPSASDLTLWAQEMGITTAPILGGSRDLLTSDPTMTADGFYLRAWPTFYFFNSEMRMVAYQVGADDATLQSNIQLIID